MRKLPINVEGDVCCGIRWGKIQHLRNHDISNVIIHFSAKKQDTIFQQPWYDIILAERESLLQKVVKKRRVSTCMDLQ